MDKLYENIFNGWVICWNVRECILGLYPRTRYFSKNREVSILDYTEEYLNQTQRTPNNVNLSGHVHTGGVGVLTLTPI